MYTRVSSLIGGTIPPVIVVSFDVPDVLLAVDERMTIMKPELLLVMTIKKMN